MRIRLGRGGGQAQEGTGRRRRGGGIKWWVLVAFAAFAAWRWFGSAETDPYTGQTAHYAASPAEEVQLGAQAYRQVLGDAEAQGALVPPDHPVSRQVRAIADRLVEQVPEVSQDLARRNQQAVPDSWHDFEWDVSVIDSGQANAFCLPGGKMAVYTGLLPVTRTEDALAVVMGHEIAHALLRHGSQRLAQQELVQLGQVAAAVAVSEADPQQQRMVLGALGAGAQYGLILPYGRNHERQADEVGLMLAAAACYDPREAIGLWERMSAAGGSGPPEFASTHPDPANRIARLQQLMPEALEFHARYCGDTALAP